MSAGKDKRSSIAFNGGVAMVLSAMKANPNDASVCCIAIMLFCSTSRPYFFQIAETGCQLLLMMTSDQDAAILLAASGKPILTTASDKHSSSNSKVRYPLSRYVENFISLRF